MNVNEKKSEPTAEATMSKPDEPSAASSSRSAQRLSRIGELQSEALKFGDPLQANLGAFNGGLMRMGFRLEELIEEQLAGISDPLARSVELTRAIDSYLRIMRQIDRFAQLDQRLSAAPPNGTSSKPR